MDPHYNHGHIELTSTTAGVTKQEQNLSDLERINFPLDGNPFELFQSWLQEVTEEGALIPNSCILSTSDGQGRVSGRALILRQLDKDGFVFQTDRRSKKCYDMIQNPRVALTFNWATPRIPTGYHSRQVRVEGILREESWSDYKTIFTTEPVYCKIRSRICRQGQWVDWEILKQKHNLELKNFTITLGEDGQNGGHYGNGGILLTEQFSEPPEHCMVFKMYPEMFDFYYATDSTIADRLVFRNCLSSESSLQMIPYQARHCDETHNKNANQGLASFEDNHVTQSQAVICETNDEKYTFNNGLPIVLGGQHDSQDQNESLNVKLEKAQIEEISTNSWIGYHVCA